MAGAQVDLGLQFDGLSRNEFQFEAARERGNVGMHFHEGEMFTDAGARPESERQVSEAMPAGGSFREEPVRVKAFGIRPMRRMSLHQIGGNEDVGGLRQKIAAD